MAREIRMRKKVRFVTATATCACLLGLCFAQPATAQEAIKTQAHSELATVAFGVEDNSTDCESKGTACSRSASCPCNCIACRDELSGDWFGRRECLANRGIVMESSLTQYYQGVASGGAEQRFRYGTKYDLYFNLDTEKMGLWNGGKFIVHAADWNIGQNSNADATFLATANANMLYPKAESSFAITQFLLEQELGRGYGAMVGRYNLLDLWLGFYPDYGRGVDGFMNVSAFVPFNIVTIGLPPVSNVAGVVKAGERGLEHGVLVYETANHPTTLGLNFPNGVTTLGFGRKYTDFFGLSGTHTLAAWYATGDFTSFDTLDWADIPAGVTEPAERSGSWSATYIAKQRIWQDPCNESRYTKLLGYIDFSDEKTNLFNTTVGGSIESFGVFSSRPNDRMGLAYFYNGLGDFKDLLNAVEASEDTHGGEVYYNAEVTHWFHLTLDVQAINESLRSRDIAVIVGLGGKIDF